MKPTPLHLPVSEQEIDAQLVDTRYHFPLGRRTFLQLMGSGVLVSMVPLAHAQRRRGRGNDTPVGARVHFGKDGSITVFTGKVECGQGARAQLTQAAAEELGVPPDRIALVMADTALVPDDGGTAGSRTTPSTVPAVREGCAAARQILIATAAAAWGVEPGKVVFAKGSATHEEKNFTYADLAADETATQKLAETLPESVTLTPWNEWEVLGNSIPRPNARDIVTGSHRYPSDIVREGMLYGKVLRRPSYTAKLKSIDKNLPMIRDGDFIGVVAPTTHEAAKRIEALAASAEWEAAPHPTSKDLAVHLRKTAEVPANPHAAEMESAAHALREKYGIAYVQHAPLEPRAAVAEWDNDGRLTVWTGTQMPFRVRGELARAFRMDEDKVRVIVPDFGGGFGGKHTGECAVECARLAKAAGKPVQLRWTRGEEFSWAYFRPAAEIEAEASLDAGGKLTSWHFVNINAGGHGLELPYRCPKVHVRSVDADPPLRHGSYRCLATTGNTFARECFMDELALVADRDPLSFRLDHLEDGRLRDVLLAAAEAFDFRKRWVAKKSAVGLACGLDKGSVVAACVEVEIDGETIRPTLVCQAFECGKIHNPDNVRTQVEGGILMGLGPALREIIHFENGRITNGSFAQYRVPRFVDLPQLDVHLLDRPDLPSVGAGETPLIAVAPAIANAVHHATGKRLRRLPLRLS
ncbi:xanthine dehydrogenase family protein molybdopterin-binding subunit [Haloferula sargassicola]|uniref:Nicotinate dehydrogenase subunit B n=1 Tax=Haloferula sargassicola TaxID=490096 RepID=A0ABP9UJ17_9BACT